MVHILDVIFRKYIRREHKRLDMFEVVQVLLGVQVVAQVDLLTRLAVQAFL